MAGLPAESPAGHVRNALALLRAARDRITELMIPADREVIELIKAAEARCWPAVNALEAPKDAPQWWHRINRFARKHGWSTSHKETV